MYTLHHIYIYSKYSAHVHVAKKLQYSPFPSPKPADNSRKNDHAWIKGCDQTRPRVPNYLGLARWSNRYII